MMIQTADQAIPHADFSGLTLEGELALRGAGGKVLNRTAGSLLFTHFGMSGPCAMDFSRHWLQEQQRLSKPPAATLSLVPGRDLARVDAWLLNACRRSPKRALRTLLSELVPERLAERIAAGHDTLGTLTREARVSVARTLTESPVPFAGSRGYSFAETTAGGVSLREVDTRTMESRVIPGLHLAGELLDVDGRIGGFNFQWAWATGWLAGRGAVGAIRVDANAGLR